MNILSGRIFSITIVIVSLWFQVYGSSAPNDVSSLATAKGCLFAGTYGKIFMSQDSGIHWSDVSQGLCDTSNLRNQKTIRCIKVTGDDSIHAITDCGEFSSTVPNIHWKQLSIDSCLFGYCAKCITNMKYVGQVNERLITADISGQIEWSQDSGKTWTVAIPGCLPCSMPIIKSLYFDTISALAGLYGGYGSAIGYHSNIIMSTDSGRTWRVTGLAENTLSINSITRMGSIVFAGAGNGIYASRDDFKTWWLIGGTSLCTSESGQKNSVSQRPASLLKEIRQDGKPYREFIYDSLGRMTALKAYDNSYSDESYTYDSLGRLRSRLYSEIEQEAYHYAADGALLSTIKFPGESNTPLFENYRYDSMVRISDATLLFNGDTTGFILFNYDCRGNTIERSEYYKNGTLFHQERCVFDSLVNPLQLSFPFDMIKKNNIVFSYHYSINMSTPPPQYSSFFQYDASGLPLRETRVSANTNDTMHFEYIYDKTAIGTIPEPSIRQTRITFSRGAPRSVVVVSMNLNAAAMTSISLCDLSGRRVTVIVEPMTLTAGNHRIPLLFDGNRFPRAGGVFMLVVKAGSEIKTFRVPVIR